MQLASMMRGAAALAVLGLVYACAEGTVTKQSSGNDDGGGGSSSQHGGGGAGGEGASGGASPCGIDCSSIMTAECTESTCNEQTKSCEIVNSETGTPCDDETFCTAGDACDGSGQCVAGPPNDCGMEAPACQTVQCNEATSDCTLVPGPNGSFCTPTDLCLVNATCLNGSCSGGMPKDCFFAPVPNECHVAVCDPADGLCKPEPDPSKLGFPCTDMADLCTVGKTCDTMGNCQGGAPKDCSQFTVGCTVGTCDAITGNCFGNPVMNGDPCDDLNDCTSGETCSNGNCSGGVAIVQCISNDSCCPANCTPVNDTDCACNAIVGPSFPNMIAGWPDAGLEFTALANAQLTSFVFNNQGQADTITLRDQNNNVVGTFNVPANSPIALTVNVNWNMSAGVHYRLTSANANNGRWADYTTWPTSGMYMQVNGTWGGGMLQTLYWFTFTQLTACP
jgi:hypothetical protein